MPKAIAGQKKPWYHHFPFGFTDELVFYTPDGFDEALFLKQFARLINQSEPEYHMHGQANISVSKLPVHITITFMPDTVASKVVFTISLFENNLVMLAGVLFSVFLYSYQSLALAGLALPAAIGFYLINLHKTIQVLRKKTLAFAGADLDLGEPGLWNLQQKWLKDPGLCPACGEPINPYSHKCVNCGLHFTKGKHKAPAENTDTSAGRLHITYENPPRHAKDSR